MELHALTEEFRRPFAPKDVEYKIQTIGKKACLCVCYVDARHVQERLNAVAGGKWSNHFSEPVIVNGKIEAVEAVITLYDGAMTVSHSDVGSMDNVNEEYHGLKALYSDAFKRAAVHFGIGVPLYSHPTSFLSKDDTELVRLHPKEKDRYGDPKPIGIEDAGQRKLRATYEKWLNEEGEQKFGKAFEI